MIKNQKYFLKFRLEPRSYKIKPKSENEEPKKVTNHYVYMHVHFGLSEIDLQTGDKKHTPVRMSTGIKLDTEQWDFKNGCIHSDHKKSLKPESLELSRYETAVENAITQLRNTKGTINHDILKNEIKECLSGKNALIKETSFLSFGDFAKTYIDQCSHKKAYKKALNTFRKLMMEYENLYSPINMADIDIGKLNEFLRVFLFQKNDYSQNSYVKLYEQLKKFLKEAENQEKADHVPISKLKPLRSERVDSYEVFLDLYELMLIANYKPFQNKTFELARDIFVILAFTSKRISEYKLFYDFYMLGALKEMKIGDKKCKYLILHPDEKNNKKDISWVPILSPVQAIIDRLGGLPEPMVEQTLNNSIKTICCDLGIDQKEVFTEFRIRGNKTVKCQKYELVSSHTGRRSFISNFSNLGFPERL